MIYLIILLTFFILYVIVLSLVYYFQRHLIFRPIKLDKDYTFHFDYPFEELWIGPRKRINALLFKAKNSIGVVLYHHGNSRNIQHWGQFHQDFTSRGYDVLFYDYNGFGKSTGILSENSLYREARLCYKFLTHRYPKENIYQFGRSLGSALATRIAMRFGRDFLVLETPYLSMRAMAKQSFPFLPVHWIIRFPLRQDLDIKKVECPILILSGTEDELTPHNHSLALSKLSDRVELVIIENGMHNGLNTYAEYQKAMDKYYGPKIQ